MGAMPLPLPGNLEIGEWKREGGSSQDGRKWLTNNGYENPQIEVGLWDPFQMAYLMAYKWG